MNPFVPIVSVFLALKQRRRDCRCDTCRNKRPKTINKLEGLLLISLAFVSVGGSAYVLYSHLTR